MDIAYTERRVWRTGDLSSEQQLAHMRTGEAGGRAVGQHGRVSMDQRQTWRKS
jgi:hypothetical protein